MKNLKLLSILFALVALLVIPVTISAEDAETEEVDLGITPDSPFYFMDKWMKQMNLAFTFGDEAKTKKSLQFAEERLAEMEAMLEQDNEQAMVKAANEYNNCLEIATRSMNKAMNKGEDVSEEVALTMSNHIAAMNGLNDEAEENLEQIMTQTREIARNCQQNAVRALAEQDPEEALNLNLQLMQQEMNRINARTGDTSEEELEEELAECERLNTMNQEIKNLAAQTGQGNALQQKIEEAIAEQNRVMNTVREQVNAMLQGEVDEPLHNQVQQSTQLKDAEEDIDGEGDTADDADVTSTGNGAGQADDSDDETQGSGGNTGSGTGTTGKGGKS